MTSVSVIKDIFRGEVFDLHHNKQDDCQSVRSRGLIEGILRSTWGFLGIEQQHIKVAEILKHVSSWARFHVKKQ